MDIAQLEQHTLEDLRQMARDASISGFSRLKKQDLMLALLRDNAEKQGYKLRGGVRPIEVDDPEADWANGKTGGSAVG